MINPPVIPSVARNLKVKICGIKSLDTALTAVGASADYLGFNFVHTSKNYIKPEKAKEIIDSIRRHPREGGDPKIVGVFQDEKLERVQEIIKHVGLDVVQLHGFEDNEYCQKVGKSVIKAFMIPSEFDVDEIRKEMSQFQVDFYMLDREKRGQGQILNPLKVKELPSEFPIFLAGGLDPENITQVLEVVHPFAVDVSSGIETEGVKDNEKIRDFIRRVKLLSS